MSYLQLNQLTRAEELFDACKIDEALELLNDQSLFEGLDLEQKSYFQFLKGLILLYQHNIAETIKVGEQMLKKGQTYNDNVYSFDGLFFIINGLIQTNKFDDAQEKVEEAEDFLKLISTKPKDIIILREVRLGLLKALLNFELGNSDIAEKYLKKPLESQKELGNTLELVWANAIMAEIMMWVKNRIDPAMEYAKRVLSIAKEIKFNHFWIVIGHAFMGIMYHWIGELETSLKHYIKTTEILKKFKSDFWMARQLNNTGLLYADLGDYEMALKCLEEALILYERDPLLTIESPISSIMTVAFKKGDTELAQKYFQRLENMYKQAPTSHIEFLYKYNKAIMLKSSSRIRDKAKAEKLFKQVIGTKKESIHIDVIIISCIHLCDLLLSEYRISYNSEVLDEINQNVTQIIAFAEKAHAYPTFCETFILQAKLALLNFDIKAARRYLTQAQKIAESYELKKLAMKISNEHDNLLKELRKWEILSESNASLAERIELARLDDQMTTMLKKRSIEVPKISKEDPVMILILTEGGNLLFSKKFIEDFSFEDDILGGFLTSVNYIISEVFSEGLDRAVFGQYTLLMIPLQPFLVCYIFKGASYFAQHKINTFVTSLKNDNITWQSLQKFFQKSKSVQLNDIPSLESKIMEIFVEKKD
ncbi:MAG: tetratricopeptide repeat protein [Promethearchaeota archaeon]